MTELAQCLGFDLTDAFPGDPETLTYLFERMGVRLANSETHTNERLFPRRQGAEDLSRLFREIVEYGGIRRRNRVPVFHELPECTILMLSIRSSLDIWFS